VDGGWTGFRGEMSNDGDERGVGGGMEGDKMGSVPEDEDAESGD
jgi:hypothetical protein